ncbi:hypothetical protein AB434_1065 [Heyndrickxia coagulans]|jgi:hypothetical protein|uniref:Uncharacterized protein n=1 Tax=Heyndrickxia coagulans TaxID=1398 RepID=A0A0C5CHQ1_HEYCO|nr:hypothetical protein [Heyndrickxia coagulans]AJO20877.1 hypothetical protein SB48_HM08orf00116 [Heyndrickxia coagulans]AKN53470.1 hypothetical protein AB434_1065 [Heyndrickxia coagulans]KWZ81838.1 hypothetical protein HMPREF3213_01851 [Heyndrickxia coagulans]KYC88594.1 hypothetical protein B4096_1414 [Heyndrickxia coagulans]WNE61562.1 hypothetical protein KIY57_17235 [Heyndrickxia coagulans]
MIWKAYIEHQESFQADNFGQWSKGIGVPGQMPNRQLLVALLIEWETQIL